MKYLIATYILFGSFWGISQTSLPAVISTEGSSGLFWSEGEFDQRTQSLSNAFSRKLFRGGEISESEINKELDRHRSLNRFGRNYGLNLAFVPKKMKFFSSEHTNWMFELGHQSFLSGSYAKGLFGLAMLGNANYLGEQVSLAESHLTLVDWQHLGVGFYHRPTGSYLTLNVVQSSAFASGDLPVGAYESGADSSWLELSATGNVEYSGGNFGQSWGLSLNGRFQYHMPTGRFGQVPILMEVKNMGIVYMPETVSYRVDTVLRYDGLNLDDILGFRNANFESANWFDTLQVERDTTGSWQLLPASIEISKPLRFVSTTPWQVFYGVRAYPFIRYLPRLHVGINAKVWSGFHAGLVAVYGGFGGFRSGLYVNYASNKLYMGLGTEDIYGLISGKGFGKMLNFRLVCAL
ncbi:MAG: hypothetical protein EP338_01805 [Bacteroidetes bacterium]|nr:MAG: hypothetical protein EP338_01805 [Bacteroidota bacterium]